VHNFDSSLAHARQSLHVAVSCLRHQHADCPREEKEATPFYDRLLCQDVSVADELATTRASLRDDELVAYILTSLDEDYNAVFTTVVARTDLIPPSELYAQLLSFEQHTSLKAHHSSSGSSSAMAATHCHGSSSGHGYDGSDQGHGRGQSNHGGSSNNDFRTSRGSATRPQCQVCLKIGHTTNNCWHRFEEDYVPNQRTAAVASSLSTDQS
jgi:hypothetical protein